jgi:hypothetical protein
MKAGYNTSTVALGFIRGDKMGKRIQWDMVSSNTRPSSTCTSKLETRPLVWKVAPYRKRNHKYLKVISVEGKKSWSRVPDGGLVSGQTGRLTVGRTITETWTWFVTTCKCGFQYMHSSHASRNRRQKGNPVNKELMTLILNKPKMIINNKKRSS